MTQSQLNRAGWLLIAAAALCIAGALAYLGPRMRPMRRGDAVDFWRAAAGVALGADTRPFMGTAVFDSDDQLYVFDSQHFHGSTLFWVERADVEALLPRVVAAIKRGDQELRRAVPEALARWKASDSQTAESLIHLIDDETYYAPTTRSQTQPFDESMPSYARRLSYHEMEIRDLEDRLRSARSYWANFVFEWFFFTSLVVIAVWPMMRGARPWRWAVHWAVLPPLFMLPFYLGYAPWSCTSVGPSGGILYPWLLQITGGWSINGLDMQIMMRLPQILDRLSQPVGPILAVSGRGTIGPTRALAGGAAIGLAAGALRIAVGWKRAPRAKEAAPARG